MAVEEWGKAHNAKLLAIGHGREAAVSHAVSTDLSKSEAGQKVPAGTGSSDTADTTSVKTCLVKLYTRQLQNALVEIVQDTS